MKEYKFRAWDKKLNQWVAVGFHVVGEVTMFNAIDMYCSENLCGDDSTLHRMRDIEISQWIGIKDKNDVDIYEGDLIRLTTPEKKSIIGEVFWMTPAFGLKIIKSEKYCGSINLTPQFLHSYLNSLIYEFEVIGNLWQGKLKSNV